MPFTRRHLLIWPAGWLGVAQAADSPQVALLKEWLAVFNGDEPSALAAFDARVSSPRPLTQTRDFRQMTGGFDLLVVERDAPGQVVALLREKASGRRARLDMRLAAGEPPRLLGLGVQLLQEASGPAQRGRRPDAQALADAVDELDAGARKDRFAGTLLVGRGERVLLEHAAGPADREQGLPMRVDSRLRIGSMNKMFTAVAVLQFVEAGRLALDDPLSRVLGAPLATAPAGRVTLRQLLGHRGGTGDVFGPEFARRRELLRTHDDYLRAFAARPLEFEPGSRFRYSNFGFVLLGAVIEKVSGRDYEDHLRERVFDPAGMAATGTLPESTPVPLRAPGYQRVEGRWVPNAATLPWRGTAAGGGYSTVGDLWRFARALQAGRLLDTRLLAEATWDGGDGYGLGFEAAGTGETRQYGHSGGAPGMNGALRVWPASGLVIAALSNLDPPAAENIVEELAGQLA